MNDPNSGGEKRKRKHLKERGPDFGIVEVFKLGPSGMKRPVGLLSWKPFRGWHGDSNR